MEASNFEEWLINNSNSTIDFQIVPIELKQGGGNANRFCIMPINRTGAESSTHAIFDVEGDTVKLIKEDHESLEGTLNQPINIEVEPSQEALAAVETFEDYLALYACNLELRIETPEKRFYIHPSNKNGATLTFTIQGNDVTLLLLTASLNEEEAVAR